MYDDDDDFDGRNAFGRRRRRRFYPTQGGYAPTRTTAPVPVAPPPWEMQPQPPVVDQIGRASCRERV